MAKPLGRREIAERLREAEGIRAFVEALGIDEGGDWTWADVSDRVAELVEGRGPAGGPASGGYEALHARVLHDVNEARDVYNQDSAHPTCQLACVALSLHAMAIAELAMIEETHAAASRLADGD